ncbi:hypothetical protein M8J76_013529 [Diaphorina citri]|nr:hypothetical protein M8J76_013529 [Diaphorina citri]KAI5735385.1 hypothetical protein M8J77_017636 [Diaphorina citri]
MSETREKTSIELEFEDIDSKNLWAVVYQRIRTVSNAYDYTLDDAKRSENRHLNRYRDVIPYDHSRIALKRCSNDYINANLVEIEQANRKYILTQGPLPNTIAHFWVMVWEQNCKAIVMLNKIIEKNQLKCSQYWPTSSSSDLEFPDVNLSVHLDSEVNHSYFITRNIRVTDKESSKERHVILFHYTTWPDFGVPQSPTALLRFIRAVRKSGALDENMGPPIVHCSAGIGRSGTFILVDCVLKLISDGEINNVSVQEILLEMRHYRMGLIQTPDQLRFSYQAIIEGIHTDWETDDESALPPCSTPVEDSKPTNGMIESAGSSDDEPPPLPPPRNASLPPFKPLPSLPSLPVTPTEEDKEVLRPSSPESDVQSDSSLINGNGSTAGVTNNNPRKRKTEEKAERIAEKVKQIKKKQSEAEDKKKKSLESDEDSESIADEDLSKVK